MCVTSAVKHRKLINCVDMSPKLNILKFYDIEWSECGEQKYEQPPFHYFFSSSFFLFYLFGQCNTKLTNIHCCVKVFKKLIV